METQNATLKLEVKRFKEQYDWSSDFNDREIAEILLALDYRLHFDHGTSGHLAYTVIEKLFSVVANS